MKMPDAITLILAIRKTAKKIKEPCYFNAVFADGHQTPPSPAWLHLIAAASLH
jgi:hypothetical protein